MAKLTLGLLTSLMLWCAPATLLGDLVWEQKSLSFHPDVSDTEVTAHFKFQNTGASVSTIQSAVAACSCTEVLVAKRSYAPGEKGEIGVRFSLGDLVGPQRKEIVVDAGGSETHSTTLTMEVDAPKIADIEPDLLRWLPGSPLQPKRVRIIPVPGVPMKVVAVQSSDSHLSVQIEPGTTPGEFTLVVTPSDDCPTFSGHLRIETDFPRAHPKALLAHVQVAR